MRQQVYIRQHFRRGNAILILIVAPHIGLMTPNQVHYGQADEVYAARQKILERAFHSNPERFVKKPPEPPLRPTATWINPPTQRLRIQA